MTHFNHSTSEWPAFCASVENEPVIAVVLHTSGPDPWRDHITHVALASGNNGVVQNVTRFEPQQLRELLAPLLSDTTRAKAFHNAKAAMRFLVPLGIAPGKIFDCMLAAQLLAGGDNTREPSLAELAQLHLGVNIPPADTNEDTVLLAEVRCVYNLRRHLVPLLVQTQLIKCAQIEFECTIPTAAMENAGLRLDAARLQQLITQGSRRMQEYTENFVKGFPGARNDLFGNAALNLHSDPQVLQFLQAQGVPVQRVNRSTLKPLVTQFPALQSLLDFRQAAGDKALESYLEHIHPITSRIHPTYSQLAAATGRYGCSNPNMQSFPRSPEHRACIVPAPGKAFVIADYSQIELRIVAQMSHDKRMLDAFRHNGDLHTLTASILTEKQPDQVNKSERQAAKAVNFGLIYSMGARGLSMYAEQTYGVEMSLDQAERFRTRYFEAYTGVQAWHNRVRREKPTTVRTLSGRLRNVPEGQLAQALNSPVQGTGADILKRALILLYPSLRPLGAQIVGIVHDEVLVEAPLTQAQAAASTVARVMEEAAREFLPDVPCPVDATVASSWAEK